MAIYEFFCNVCHNDSELLLRSGDIPRCSHCGSENLERKISTFAIGSGSATAKSCGCGGCEPVGAGSGGCGGSCGCGGH